MLGQRLEALAEALIRFGGVLLEAAEVAGPGAAIVVRVDELVVADAQRRVPRVPLPGPPRKLHASEHRDRLVCGRRSGETDVASLKVASRELLVVQVTDTRGGKLVGGFDDVDDVLLPRLAAVHGDLDLDCVEHLDGRRPGRGRDAHPVLAIFGLL